jgi:hypothetical protein
VVNPRYRICVFQKKGIESVEHCATQGFNLV